METLEADLQVYIKQMRDLKRELALSQSLILRQVILNLMGKNNADMPTRMVGDAITEEGNQLHNSDPMFPATIDLFQGLLCTIFGEHIQLADQVVAKVSARILHNARIE